MKRSLMLFAVVLALGLVAADADAKRLGGGGNLGRQRASPMMREAPSAAPAVPAKSAQPAPATPSAVAPPAQPGFMGRWGGVLAGLGAGALLGSLFGGQLGGGAGSLIMLLLLGGLAFVLFRTFAARRDASVKPMQYAGIGSALPPAAPMSMGGGASYPPEAQRSPSGELPPGFEAEPFLRIAKTSFIRLQAANDAKDLDDIRDYTTPEMYAELAMQIRERGEAPQRTEVVTLNAELAEAVVEGDYAIASVRFSGLIRETAGGNAEAFDEVWHVRKHLNDAKATWLIAGIQQAS